MSVVPGAEVSLVWALKARGEQLVLETYGQRALPADRDPERCHAARAASLPVAARAPSRIPSTAKRFSASRSDSSAFAIRACCCRSTQTRWWRGSKARGLGEHLPRQGIAHVVASDGHRAASWRPVSALSAPVEAAASLVGVRARRGSRPTRPRRSSKARCWQERGDRRSSAGIAPPHMDWKAVSVNVVRESAWVPTSCTSAGAA